MRAERLVTLITITASLGAALLAATSCASTAAYLERDPTKTEVVAVASSAAKCLDQAGANVIGQHHWTKVLTDALTCVDALVREHALELALRSPTREEVHVKVEEKQTDEIKTLQFEAVSKPPTAITNPHE